MAVSCEDVCHYTGTELPTVIQVCFINLPSDIFCNSVMTQSLKTLLELRECAKFEEFQMSYICPCLVFMCHFDFYLLISCTSQIHFLTKTCMHAVEVVSN